MRSIYKYLNTKLMLQPTQLSRIETQLVLSKVKEMFVKKMKMKMNTPRAVKII